MEQKLQHHTDQNLQNRDKYKGSIIYYKHFLHRLQKLIKKEQMSRTTGAVVRDVFI